MWWRLPFYAGFTLFVMMHAQTVDGKGNLKRRCLE